MFGETTGAGYPTPLPSHEEAHAIPLLGSSLFESMPLGRGQTRIGRQEFPRSCSSARPISTDSKQGCLVLAHASHNDSVCAFLFSSFLNYQPIDDFLRLHRITRFQNLEGQRASLFRSSILLSHASLNLAVPLGDGVRMRGMGAFVPATTSPRMGIRALETSFSFSRRVSRWIAPPQLEIAAAPAAGAKGRLYPSHGHLIRCRRQ